jgi:hypothetical protein
MSEWKTKRFILFVGMTYYPSGGIADFLDTFDTKEEVEAARDKWLEENGSLTWTQIADLATGEWWAKGDDGIEFWELFHSKP